MTQMRREHAKSGGITPRCHTVAFGRNRALPPFVVPPLGGPRGASSICRPAGRGTGRRNERVETCLLHRPTKYIGALLPTWRNWQTRQTQNLVLVRVCGFDPLRRHQPSPAKAVAP